MKQHGLGDLSVTKQNKTKQNKLLVCQFPSCKILGTFEGKQ
jgi:hypothetical protein